MSHIPPVFLSKQVDVVELTRELIRRRSDEGTREVITYVENLAQKFGFETQRIQTIDTDGSTDDQNPNLVIGKSLNTLPRVLFASHIDTAPAWWVDPKAEEGHHDPFAADIVDGKIIGRGASDSKGGIAAQLAALINRRKDLPDACALLLTARNQTDLRGIRCSTNYYASIEAQNPGTSIDLIFTSGSDCEYATGSRGVLAVKIGLEGKTEHAAELAKRQSASEIRERIEKNVKQKVLEIPEHPALGRASLCVTAGESRAVINYYKEEIIENWAQAVLVCWLNGMPIDGKPFTPETIERLVQKQVSRYKKGGIRLSCFNILSYMEATIFDQTQIEWIIRKAQQITGHMIKPWDYGSRELVETVELVRTLKRRPAFIALGPGNQHQYCRSDEYVEIQSLKNYEQIYGYVVTDERFKVTSSTSS